MTGSSETIWLTRALARLADELEPGMILGTICVTVIDPAAGQVISYSLGTGSPEIRRLAVPVADALGAVAAFAAHVTDLTPPDSPPP